MLYLKTCPRCSGDMYLDRDLYGPFKECLQCGYIMDIAAATRMAMRSAGRKVKRIHVTKVAA